MLSFLQEYLKKSNNFYLFDWNKQSDPKEIISLVKQTGIAFF